ncbi:MAG: cobalt-precorrin-5B (C(1))-methyltransferase [Nitrososphaerales archaeon]
MSDDLEKLAESEQQLPPEIEEKRRKGVLRTGYTTGTCAAAATKAALLAILSKNTVHEVFVTLPKGNTAKLKIGRCNLDHGEAECAVIKDAGDDPDVTHGAEIVSTVTWTDNVGMIEIVGGKGVGKVTKPGIGLEIGKPAINPTPMKMLIDTVKEVADEQLKIRGIKVTISVPRGEELATLTDNPRLGIIGGISILGTSGIVLPYSTGSFTASIRQSLDVAKAMNQDTIVLTTGGRSEDFSKELLQLPEDCYVQMGDFAAYSVRQALIKGMRKVIIAGFVGKLSKMAMGVKQTHVRGSHVDLEFMALVAKDCGATDELVREIQNANTARHVSEIIMSNKLDGYFDLLCRKVHDMMVGHTRGQIRIECIMFDFDGRVIGRYHQR